MGLLQSLEIILEFCNTKNKSNDSPSSLTKNCFDGNIATALMLKSMELVYQKRTRIMALPSSFCMSGRS